MGLMQLLLVGRSLKTARNRRSPYRLRQQYLLPRFGAEPASVESAKEPSRLTDIKVSRPASSTPPVRRLEETGLPAAGVAPQVPTRPAAGERQGFSIWNLFRRRKPAARTLGPMQGELLLESVRVVRNDLSDSDLEVVPSVAGESASPKAPGKPASVTAKRPEPVWSRMAERTLDVTRT